MSRDTRVDIGEATSASNTPRDGTDGGSSSDEWATRVSHAGTLSGLSEGADLPCEDHACVSRCGVTTLAVGVGDGASVQHHQVSGTTAGMLENEENRRLGYKELGDLRTWLLTAVCPHPVITAAPAPTVAWPKGMG